MKHILVTGASGYIGSHVCKLLKEHGYKVTGWDKEIYPKHNKLHIDSYKVKDINRTLLFGSFDAVVHLAARTRVSDSMHSPSVYYDTNINGAATVLEQIATGHFIFASTSSAFEMASPYAISKVAAEQIIRERLKKLVSSREAGD